MFFSLNEKLQIFEACVSIKQLCQLVGKSAHLKQKLKHSIREGWVLSPDFLSLYSAMIMRNLVEEYLGINVGGHNVNNLRYADDTVLTVEDKGDMQRLLDIVEMKKKSERKGWN